jgi:uncharacterized coiled-coil protein SlyX
MMAVEERLAHVEGLVAGQSLLLGDLRTSLTNFEARVDQRFDQIDQRFDQIDQRFVQIDGRFTIVEGRLAAIDRRIDALDQKIDTRCDALEQRLGARIDALGSKIGAVEGQLRGVGDTLTSTAQDIRRDAKVIFGWTMAGMMTIIATAFFTR